MNAVDLRFCFAEGLLREPSPLYRLFTVVREEFPKWSSKLSLVRGPREKIELSKLSDVEAASRVATIATSHGPRFYELQAKFGKSTQGRQLGSAEMRGSDSSLTIVASFDEDVFARNGMAYIWGNRIVLQARGKLATTTTATLRLRTLFWRLCRDLSPAYAFCCAVDEYEDKNMDLSGGGTRAIGIDMAKYFPGLYWQNYFRSDVVKKIWGEIPAISSCVDKFDIEDNFGFGLLAGPHSWNSPDRYACEQDVRHVLGEELFFDRHTPERTGTHRLRNMLFSASHLD